MVARQVHVLKVAVSKTAPATTQVTMPITDPERKRQYAKERREKNPETVA